MRKRSKNASRRPRPATAPANTYRVETRAMSMADVRKHLDVRRRFPRIPADNMLAAIDQAWPDGRIGKAPTLTRRQRWEARVLRREAKAKEAA